MDTTRDFWNRRSPNGEFATAVATSFLLHAACFVLLTIPLAFIGSSLGRQAVEIDVVQIAAAEYHASDPIGDGDHSDQTADDFGDDLTADALPGEFNFEYAAAEAVPLTMTSVGDVPLFTAEPQKKPVVTFTTLSKPVSLTSSASNRSGTPIKRTTKVLCRNFEEYKAIVEKWEFQRVSYKPTDLSKGEWGEWVYVHLTQQQVDEYDRMIFGETDRPVGYLPGSQLKSEQMRIEDEHPQSRRFEYALTIKELSLATCR